MHMKRKASHSRLWQTQAASPYRNSGLHHIFWIAVSVYVLVAIIRKRLRLEASLYQTLQILSVTLFEKTPISCALQAIDMEADFTENVNATRVI